MVHRANGTASAQMAVIENWFEETKNKANK
jgi:hypothetical protein